MLRLLLTIWVAKLAGFGLRTLGRQGTHLPGLIARKLHPGILGAIRHPARVVAVTGTNGKTTVSNLLAEALAGEGLRVASNRTGSNLAAGVATTLIGAVTWTGRSRADIAVMELDERSAKLVLPGLAPDVLVCMNLTRDSIKRNAHPAYIAWIISSALSESTSLVLNADDLITSSLGGESNRKTFFAVDRMPTDGDSPSGAAVDVAICPDCDHPLSWEYWRFNHIGKAFCTACGFRAPEAAYRARDVDAAAGRVTLDLDGESRSARLINASIVNVYNEIAVAAALDQLGVARDRIVAAFDTLEPPATRFTAEKVGDVRLVRILTKGLVGVACSRAFEYLASFGGRKAVVLNIDEVSERVTEVENTAWTYDADYEYLADDSLRQVVVGGVRRHDQALRLAIAGVDPERIVTVESETATPDAIQLDGMDDVFNLHSVHNALITGNPVQQRLRERLPGDLVSLTIEVLFPEIANLHGDNANITYLAQCRPDARVVRTGLTDTPEFVSGSPDLVYLGPLTEQGQLKAVERLRPHRDHLAALIESGTSFLFTHNALEVLGARIRNDEMGYDVSGLGIFELEATLSMFGRYNGKVMGTVPEVAAEHPVLGYKSQFSMVSADAALPGFLTADRGIGRNTSTAVEGVRVGNFIGTSLIGPILIVNPHFTRALLTRLDPNTEPTLAHERFALAAYEARLSDFRDDRRWHPFERVR